MEIEKVEQNLGEVAGYEEGFKDGAEFAKEPALDIQRVERFGMFQPK